MLHIEYSNAIQTSYTERKNMITQHQKVALAEKARSIAAEIKELTGDSYSVTTSNANEQVLTNDAADQDKITLFYQPVYSNGIQELEIVTLFGFPDIKPKPYMRQAFKIERTALSIAREIVTECLSPYRNTLIQALRFENRQLLEAAKREKVAAELIARSEGILHRVPYHDDEYTTRIETDRSGSRRKVIQNLVAHVDIRSSGEIAVSFDIHGLTEMQAKIITNALRSCVERND